MTVKDIVCGMTIEHTKAAATSSYQNKEYYFCSVSCRETFDKDPQKYAEKKSAA